MDKKQQLAYNEFSSDHTATPTYRFHPSDSMAGVASERVVYRLVEGAVNFQRVVCLLKIGVIRHTSVYSQPVYSTLHELWEDLGVAPPLTAILNQ
jgi:hypothetical protein